MSRLLMLLSWLSVGQARWQENARPKVFGQLSDFAAFKGTNVSHADHFVSLLVASDPSVNGDNVVVLVGGRNAVYKLDAADLRLKQKLVWESSSHDRESCTVKGGDTLKCQNYVKVLAQYSEDPRKLLVCGTNAFRPLCRDYVDERGGFVGGKNSERSGLGLAPFDPDHNSTATLVGGRVFSATVADWHGVDPIIFREPLRTRQYDSTQLNQPDFVGSFAHNGHVYFFFRESAVEHLNCGKAIFSRVARVCQNDRGGPNKARNQWTSFLKTRLNCSVPGNLPFYFDEIQGVHHVPVTGLYGDTQRREQLVYATFTTPVNAIGGSAVCVFRMEDITRAFEGQFKAQKSTNQNWLPVEEHKVPTPRPGSCNVSPEELSETHMNFIRSHFLMDETVQPVFGGPLVVRTAMMSRFTAITVDPQIRATDGKTYDVVFVGTTNGRVLKCINTLSSSSLTANNAVIIEELQVFPTDVVRSLRIIGAGGSDERRLASLSQLAVMTDAEVRAFPVHRCDRVKTCSECVALQDPYCAWEIKSERCTSGDWTAQMSSAFLQSVATGIHEQCPDSVDAESFSENSPVFSLEKHLSSMRLGQIINLVDDKDRQGSSDDADINTNGKDGYQDRLGTGVKIESLEHSFTLETLVITVAAGAVAALVVGFITGYCCGRRCGKNSGSSNGHLMMVPFPDTEYEYFEQRGNVARPQTTMLPINGSTVQRPMMSDPRSTVASGAGMPLLQHYKNEHHQPQEEVTYAEPDLVNTDYPRLLPSVPSQYEPEQEELEEEVSSHYSSSLLNSTAAPRFNTLSAGRAVLPTANAYESAAEAQLGSGKDPVYYARGRDNLQSYHLSTMSRGRRGNNNALDSSGGSLESKSNSAAPVDSAYGTTRSTKTKAFL